LQDLTTSQVDSSEVSERLGVERHLPDRGAAPLADPTPERLAEEIERHGLSLGLTRIGFAEVVSLERGRTRLEAFRAKGYAGDLEYLLTGDRHDPRALLPEAKSAVVALMAYGSPTRFVPLRTPARPRGVIAQYALGDDYHMVVKQKLSKLAARVATLVGREVIARVCVDTAPLLERELALAAGLGFQGKSTLLIAPGLGSNVLIGELLLDVELALKKTSSSGCGSCRACLDACPTQAFPEEYVLDSRRCVSYLTIEYEGIVPREYRRALGARVFGCDACQDVCPHNAASARPRAPLAEARPWLQAPDLIELLELGAAAYRKFVRRTALRRVSRATLQRNAAIALGNSGSALAVRPLLKAMRGNARAVVRTHAAWALGELAAHLDGEALLALCTTRDADPDPTTRAEAKLVLDRLEPGVPA
jgi:epoxyqueuosine reductase